MRRLPNESTIYLGDNARAPYGPRSDDEVRRFSAECLDELAARDVKAIVVACNTSSAVALNELRLRYPLPIMGVVRPGAAAAALATRTGRVGVIATAATVRSHAYFQAIKEENAFLRVTELATPGARATGRGWPAGRPARRGGGWPSRSRRCAPPPKTASTRCCSVVRTTRFWRRSSSARSAAAWRSSTRLRPRPRRLRHLLDVQALARLGRCETRPRPTHHRRRDAVQAIAERLFGQLFPAVEPVASGDGRMSKSRPRMTTLRRDRRNERNQRHRRSSPIGAAGIAIASRYLARRAHTAAGDGLVDWRRAEQIAVSRLRPRRRAPCRSHELRAAEPPTPRRWQPSCRCSKSSSSCRCRASSSATPSSTAPAGRAPTWSPSRA